MTPVRNDTRCSKLQDAKPFLSLNADSPTSSKGNFASADAARVGGGLYSHVLEALCTLTTDPAPSVAKTGRAVLGSAGVQLMPVTQTIGSLPGLRSLTQSSLEFKPTALEAPPQHLYAQFCNVISLHHFQWRRVRRQEM